MNKGAFLLVLQLLRIGDISYTMQIKNKSKPAKVYNVALNAMVLQKHAGRVRPVDNLTDGDNATCEFLDGDILFEIALDRNYTLGDVQLTFRSKVVPGITIRVASAKDCYEGDECLPDFPDRVLSKFECLPAPYGQFVTIATHAGYDAMIYQISVFQVSAPGIALKINVTMRDLNDDELDDPPEEKAIKFGTKGFRLSAYNPFVVTLDKNYSVGRVEIVADGSTLPRVRIIVSATEKADFFTTTFCEFLTSIRYRCGIEPSVQYAEISSFDTASHLCEIMVFKDIDSGWGDWGAWSRCTKSCNTGTRHRTRVCADAVGCPGKAMSQSTCANIRCHAVDGVWGQWSSDSQCSSACTWIRKRACDSPSPSNGGKPCPGNSTMTIACKKSPCAVDGGWSSWLPGACSVTCGKGIERRSRSCNSPSTTQGGKDCSGEASQTVDCVKQNCPVNGGWGEWSRDSCSISCGKGMSTRMRNCDNPPPSSNGRPCVGSSIQTVVSCENRICPVDGEWSQWTPGVCTVTCGQGTKTRTRTCDNPSPAGGGKLCSGKNSDTLNCFMSPCPVNGGWSEWMRGNCTVKCGRGIEIQTRSCNKPCPQNGGKDCYGDTTRSVTCEKIACADRGSWSVWSAGRCSVTCGSGTQTRSRTCSVLSIQKNAENNCVGAANETVTCTAPACPSVDGCWSQWLQGACSQTCGGGMLIRSRLCNNPPPSNGGKVCQGRSTEQISCGTPSPCPAFGGWSTWSESACSVTCGSGIVINTRQCNNPQPQNGGMKCEGRKNVTRACHMATCHEMPTLPNLIIAVETTLLAAVSLALILVLIRNVKYHPGECENKTCTKKPFDSDDEDKHTEGATPETPLLACKFTTKKPNKKSKYQLATD